MPDEENPATDAAEEEIPQEEEVVEEETEEEKEPEVDPEKQKQIDEHNKKLGIPDQKTKKKNTFQDRIDELTKQFRTAERTTQDLQKQLGDRDKDFESLRKHNEDLMGVVKKSFEAPPAPEGKKPETILKDLRSNKQKLMAEYQQVRTTDYDAALEIQDKINVLQDQIEDVLTAISKGPKEEDIEKVVEKVSTKKRAKDDQEAARTAADEFIERNAEWFSEQIPDATGKLAKNEKFDSNKHYMAIGMEDALSKTWKGSPAELFKHIEDEINKRFPPKAPLGKPKIPAVGGTGGVEAQGKVTLTSEQSRVARALFGDDPKAEEKYAEQLKFMRGGK